MPWSIRAYERNERPSAIGYRLSAGSQPKKVAAMGDYKSLRVWQGAHQVTLAVYAATRSFPPAELYGLSSQIRRAAASIPANIVEGCGRNSDAELRRFCSISLGSANELEYHLLLARDLGIMETAEHERLSEQVLAVKRMLAKFASTL
jgi:four helix bundle protein